MAWISPLYLFIFRMKGKVNSSNDSESDGLPGVCVCAGWYEGPSSHALAYDGLVLQIQRSPSPYPT